MGRLNKVDDIFAVVMSPYMLRWGKFRRSSPFLCADTATIASMRRGWRIARTV